MKGQLCKERECSERLSTRKDGWRLFGFCQPGGVSWNCSCIRDAEIMIYWIMPSCCCGYSILWYVMRVQRLQVSVSSLRTLGPIADNHHHMLAILWSQRDTHFLTPRQINNISMNMLHMFDVFPDRTENLSNLALLWFKASSASSTTLKYIQIYTVYYKVINVSQCQYHCITINLANTSPWYFITSFFRPTAWRSAAWSRCPDWPTECCVVRCWWIRFPGRFD